METKKYIIEIPDNTAWLQWVKVSDKDGHVCFDFKDPEDLTPYTEPDLDAVKKEAYQQGYKDGYNKHDTEKIRKRGYDKGLDDIGNALRLLLFQYSNYTLQEIFGYDTARAVVEHFEGSEIVARIRCYEGGVKQDAETIRKEAYDKGYQDATVKIGSDEQAVAEKAYQKGLNDAWDAARKILLSKEDGGLLEYDERKAVFGYGNYFLVLKKCSASEAVEKIRQYEQEQEQPMQVGDEVVGGKGGRGIITKISDDSDHFNVMWENGSTGYYMIGDFKKTGRHFPEIVEVLRKMREEKE